MPGIKLNPSDKLPMFNQGILNNMKRRFNAGFWLSILIVFSTVPMLSGCDLLFESLTRSCAYSEVVLPAPAGMARAEFSLVKDAYLGVGQDVNYACLKSLGKQGFFMSERAMSGTVRTWYKQQGVELVPLRTDKIFQFAYFVALVKHGIGTIDSGKGPYYFLVLKDPSGALYYVSVPGLGINLDDRFVSMKLPDAESILINHRNFDTSNDVDHPSIQLRKIDAVQ